MPKISFAQQIAEWDRLVANAQPYTEEYRELGPILDEIKARRQRMVELDQKRQVLRAQVQTATREIDRLKGEGKDYVMRASDFMRSRFGIGSPYLRAFNLKPRGQYKKRKKRAKAEEASDAGDAPAAS
jgi:hypothetical protein